MKRKIGDKFLVVTTGELAKKRNMFIELNDTSSEIWDYIEKGYDENKIASQLCKEYGIGEERAKKDVEGLIASMREAGVFEE